MSQAPRRFLGAVCRCRNDSPSWHRPWSKQTRAPRRFAKRSLARVETIAFFFTSPSAPASVRAWSWTAFPTPARAAAAAGDRNALQVVQTASEALGATVGLMVNMLDPEAVVVGGGLGSAGGLYWEDFVASAAAHLVGDAPRDADHHRR